MAARDRDRERDAALLDRDPFADLPDLLLADLLRPLLADLREALLADLCVVLVEKTDDVMNDVYTMLWEISR